MTIECGSFCCPLKGPSKPASLKFILQLPHWTKGQMPKSTQKQKKGRGEWEGMRTE